MRGFSRATLTDSVCRSDPILVRRSMSFPLMDVLWGKRKRSPISFPVLVKERQELRFLDMFECGPTLERGAGISFLLQNPTIGPRSIFFLEVALPLPAPSARLLPSLDPYHRYHRHNFVTIFHPPTVSFVERTISTLAHILAPSSSSSGHGLLIPTYWSGQKCGDASL